MRRSIYQMFGGDDWNAEHRTANTERRITDARQHGCVPIQRSGFWVARLPLINTALLRLRAVGRLSHSGFCVRRSAFGVRHPALSLAFFLSLLVLGFSATAHALVDLGIDVLEQSNYALLKGKRVGLVTNQTGA